MKTQDFDYELPEELIAQYPAGERGASRLLYLDGKTGALRDARFNELPRFLQPRDVLVFNDTRVIKARLHGVRDTGGKTEVLVERVLDEHHVIASVRSSHSPKPGSGLTLAGELHVTVIERHGEFYQLRFDAETPVLEMLERCGSVPLPPYIARVSEKIDEERYQTVFAKEPGAVAAPTAGLHFDEQMLETIRRLGVTTARITLHVGAGTFQPVRVEDVSKHKMHSEIFHVPQNTVDAINRARVSGGRVLAVGSTSLRALEAAARDGELKAGYGETDLFIVPGYRFCVVERLLTNFHLPKSTLLMLVSAFGGMDNIRRAYRYAVEQRYRFFSYGDAMLIETQQD